MSGESSLVRRSGKEIPPLSLLPFVGGSSFVADVLSLSLAGFDRFSSSACDAAAKSHSFIACSHAIRASRVREREIIADLIPAPVFSHVVCPQLPVCASFCLLMQATKKLMFSCSCVAQPFTLAHPHAHGCGCTQGDGGAEVPGIRELQSPDPRIPVPVWTLRLHGI